MTETVTGVGDQLRGTMTDCTYCGCAVEAHDPVFVYEEREGEREDEREDEGEWAGKSEGNGEVEREEENEGEDEGEQVPAGQFCNYACLSAHIKESNLADGTVCRLDA
jgi:hypothetical protein